MPDTKPVKFILLASVRTGSTMVVDLLDQTPAVSAYGELFLEKPKGTQTGFGFVAGQKDYPHFADSPQQSTSPYPQSVLKYLADFYDTRTNAQAVGFKFMYHQLEKHPAVLAYAKQNSVRVVHLVRRNHLDVLTSIELTTATGQTHVLKGNVKNQLPRIRLEANSLIDECKQMQSNMEAAGELMGRIGIQNISIAYEDIVLDRSALAPVFDFLSLEISEIPHESKLVRIQNRKRSEIIENIDEVKKTLQGSAFASLAEDT